MLAKRSLLSVNGMTELSCHALENGGIRGEVGVGRLHRIYDMFYSRSVLAVVALAVCTLAAPITPRQDQNQGQPISVGVSRTNPINH